MASLKGSKTYRNLKGAFGIESEASCRHLYFARQADREGNLDVGGLFRDRAEAEIGHAHGHLDYLKALGDPPVAFPLGSTAKQLGTAVAEAANAFAKMYSGMARDARDEGFSDVAEWFETLAKSEKSHAGHFQKALDRLSKG